MDFLKKIWKAILRVNRNPNCYFYQARKCILCKNSCILCSSYIKGIEGINNTMDYISIVNSANQFRSTFYLSIISTIIAVIALIFSIIGN